MNNKFLQPYNPNETESAIYKKWEDSGFFNPDECIKAGKTSADAEVFSIVLPPPNVTGVLHLGHAFENTVQDTLIRYNRMKGKKTLWLPGTDSAAIATQSKFEKQLYKKEKKSRHDFERDEFFNMIQDFAKENQTSILGQLKTLGSSLDWSRLCFALDDDRQHAVFEAFKRMYDAGLIYQKNRVVNWDPKGQTTISDDEVVHEERKATMYTFKYSKDFPFAISSTRPETKVGDTAVAVHPDDKRYTEYIGMKYSCNFAGEDITVTIIADEHADPELGTGALGVTPAHSIADWEISERHNLPIKQVINEYGKMTVGMEGVKDTKSAVARENVAQWLRDNDLMIEEEEITQNVGTAERTGAIVEPLPKLQWWINVDKKFPYPHETLEGIEKDQEVSLKDLMGHVIENKSVTIQPDRFNKVYTDWMEKLRDWNISRQIIYGHRIPVWQKDGEMQVSETSPGDGWAQETDTLDTWFSSGLWTFSTLGWPNKTEDLQNFHPTSVVNPGYEILFFWVARMILMSTFLVGEIPFKNVLIHGMLRDPKGQKFSKSLDNGIEPEDVINDFGTDALRMSLLVGVAPGQDMNFTTDKVRAYKKFSNKIWNASRFVVENTEGLDPESKPDLIESDQKYINELQNLITEVTKEMDEYRFYIVAEKLYHYFWHTFADVIIEDCKKRINEGTPEESSSAKWTLYHILTTSLRLLHPFTPFVTEEIWSLLPHTNDDDMLMVESWPKNRE